MAVSVLSCNWAPDKIDVKNVSIYKEITIIRGLKSELEVEGYNFQVLEYPNQDIVNFASRESGHYELTGISPGSTMFSIEYLVDSENESALSSIIYVNIEVSNGIPVDVFVAYTVQLDMQLYIAETIQMTTASMDIQYPGEDSLMHSEVHIAPGTFLLNFFGLSPGHDSLIVNFYDTADSVILALPFNIESSIKKIPLIELFTNSGCINCPEANHYLDNIYDNYNDDMTVVRYHVSWTDPQDPMNLYNPDEVADRVSYYNIFFAPALVLDGGLISSLDENDWINRIIGASRQETSVYISPIVISMSEDSLHVSFELESFDVDMADHMVWTLVLEDSIDFAGSNGETIHMQVMRDMTRVQVSGNLVNFNLNQSLKIPDTFDVGAPLSLLVFLQNNSNQQVIQSRKQVIN